MKNFYDHKGRPLQAASDPSRAAVLALTAAEFAVSKVGYNCYPDRDHAADYLRRARRLDKATTYAIYNSSKIA